jgi:Ca2+-transporting ATPase
MERTPLQETTGRLVLRLGVIAVVFCLLVAAAYGFIRGDWFAGGLAGLTIAISLLPEEFPMVLAVFLAIGSWRLARHQVLVRRSAVVETLGAMTMLCVDKTGTLTENRKIQTIWANAEQLGVDMNFAAEMSLACPSCVCGSPRVRWRLCVSQAVVPSLLTSYGGEPVSSFPLRPDRLAVIQSWSTDTGTVWASKGARGNFAALQTPLPNSDLLRLHWPVWRRADCRSVVPKPMTQTRQLAILKMRRSNSSA